MPIYLDYHATTPLDPRVLEAMAPYLAGRFGNPHSVDHAIGLAARDAVDRARGEIAALIGADPSEILFTSGATEANNLAIHGALAALEDSHAGVVATPIEHPSVRETVAAEAAGGRPAISVPVDREGLVDPAAFEAALGADTRLATVMLANNEIGTVQPVAELARVCRRRGILLHSDAAQGAGKLPIDVGRLGVDLMSLTSHKMYGPMGVGALYVRRGVRISPLLHGGQQESGLRPGTLPLPLCVGFGAAAAVAGAEMTAEMPRVAALRDRLLQALRQRCPGLRLNGSARHRLRGNLNLTVPGVEAEEWLAAVPELALSTGAACASGAQTPSHVLRAIGLTPEEIAGSFRIGLGRFTTEAEIDRAAELLAGALERLPLRH